MAFLIGIVVGEFLHLPWWLFVILLLVVGINVYLVRSERYWLVFFSLFVFGIFWNGVFQPMGSIHDISYYSGQKITFEGVVTREPDMRIGQQKLIIDPINYRGNILLNLKLYPEYKYGDKLEIHCQIKKPEAIDDFRYDKYLEKESVFAVCYNPSIKFIKANQANFVVKDILIFKKFIQDKIVQSISEPHASLLAGILIGSRQGLPQELVSGFNITGITHIVAISGFNITIIVVFLMNIFRELRLNRKKAFWYIVAVLVAFGILTGFSASVMRAIVMAIIVLFARQIGRTTKLENVLIFTVTIMCLINPRILIWDAGFHLSFLATIGLIYLSPRLEKPLAWLPEKFSLRENIIATLSAIIITLPYILFTFNRLSIVALLVNLLVLPVVPIIMSVGFIQIILAIPWAFLGQIVGWINWLLISYLITVVGFFAGLSWSSIGLKISFVVMVILYIGLAYFILKNKKEMV